MLLERPFLFAIADGMGGYNAGEVASKLALEKLKAEKDDLYGKNGFALVSKLYQIMRDVNVEVYKKAQSEYTLEGMGTTLSGIYFNGKGKGYVFNVGDSRVYLLRQGQLKQITRDHSLVAEMVENGELTQEEAFNHPQKNIITKCLGTEETVESDTYRTGEVPEKLLLCSDGLSNALTEQFIFDVIQDTARSAEEKVGLLIDAANKAGGPDNITVILVQND